MMMWVILASFSQAQQQTKTKINLLDDWYKSSYLGSLVLWRISDAEKPFYEVWIVNLKIWKLNKHELRLRLGLKEVFYLLKVHFYPRWNAYWKITCWLYSVKWAIHTFQFFKQAAMGTTKWFNTSLRLNDVVTLPFIHDQIWDFQLGFRRMNLLLNPYIEGIGTKSILH